VHAYSALENGFRIRAIGENLSPKRRGLRAFIEHACEHGWLNRSDWEVPDAPNLLETVVMLCNHIGHGNPQLLQPLSVEAIRLCMEILNRLFPS
jgi:hypothetical protein